MARGSRQPSIAIENTIANKAEYIINHNQSTITDIGNYLVSGVMDGSSLNLTMHDTSVVTVLDVDSEGAFDHWTAGSLVADVSEAEALTDWNNA